MLIINKDTIDRMKSDKATIEHLENIIDYYKTVADGKTAAHLDNIILKHDNQVLQARVAHLSDQLEDTEIKLQSYKEMYGAEMEAANKWCERASRYKETADRLDNACNSKDQYIHYLENK